MPLSRIAPMDMDQVRELLTETTSAMNTVQHLKSSLVDTKQLLQILRLNDLVQSVLIGSHDNDSQFNDAVKAIEATHYFMSRFDKKPLTYYPTWIDNMDAIHVATCLLTPTQRAKSDVVDHGAVDDNDVLRNVFCRGSHCYTEDNIVAFLKWDKKVDGLMMGAQVLKDIDRRHNESQNVAVRPVKKHHVHFKGSNIAVQVQTAMDVDALSDMLLHTST
ncbi:hypothetical protein IW261DRAFT_1426240 [Armillaria novae-zelandiae]|uniref:Uncharacterized protein n=1 Tax=Armillaria novae-zelandiae TaxID=153914 RepID=A0AA39U163_9AGAR|nr:hypothetical protein IW261DRAFT_1426240 [Armillaria novae-zelandiae]